MKQLYLFLCCIPFLGMAQPSKFIIGVYNSPAANEQEFRVLVDGGFNTIYAANPRRFNPWKACEEEQDVSTLRGKIISLAEAHGLNILLDGSWATQSSSQRLVINTYNKMKAFQGVLLPTISGNAHATSWPLPYAMRFDRILRRKYPKKERYITILPNNASRKLLGNHKEDPQANYQAYLQLLQDKITPQAMVLAHYPKTFGEGKAGNYASSIEKDAFLHNLEEVANFSKHAQTPFFANIMGTAHDDIQYAPTFYMYRMMVNAAIVYGAEGIFYYTYNCPCDDTGLDKSFYGPFVGATYLYDKHYWYAVKKLNKTLAYLGPHLLKAKWKYSERWTNSEEQHKICLDSCELLEIVHTDTTNYKYKAKSVFAGLATAIEKDSIMLDTNFVMSREGWDTVYLSNYLTSYSVEDHLILEELKDTLEKSDSFLIDSSFVDSLGDWHLDQLPQNTLDSLAQLYLTPHHSVQVVSKRIKKVDVSKNISIEATGKNLDLLFSVSDYGENKLIMLMNYNYDKTNETLLQFDFGKDFDVLELSANTQTFSKRTQVHQTKIEGGDMSIFMLKKVDSK